MLDVKLGTWAVAHGFTAFGSRTLFLCGDRKIWPDEALMRTDRFATLSAEEQESSVRLAPDVAVESVSRCQGDGKTRCGAPLKCEAMFAAGAGSVVMLDPDAAAEAERVTRWGTAPAEFQIDWEDVLR
jgi:hypothetical protein